MTAFALLSLLLLSPVSSNSIEEIYKLRNSSKPVFYKLHLEPDIVENEFKGSVIVDFKMLITSSVIVLNQKQLIINTIEVKNYTIQKWVDDHELELLVMYFESKFIEDHTYRLTITYEGILNVSKRGFYKSRYIMGNETRWIATTHFEPTGARLAFPCYDEPKYKAEFDISIRHSSNYPTVISNMPVLNQTQNNDGTITTYFYRTMRMSTYLVAFIVSDYAYKSHDNDTFKIYTKPDSVDKTELAYNFSLEAMKVLEEYTKIPYFHMNPKMDQVTIRDFEPNAMENWGLITYKENTILYEEGVSTSGDKENIITTIVHEFVHQWFGNLVTPKWWQFLWLNEGFANYFQYFITDKLKPSWRLMDLYPVEAMQQAAFIMDTRTSRFMNSNVNHPKDIASIFDAITYQKAGCILRMLSHILTEKVFRTALRNYLRDRSYTVADSDDLIRHLQNAAGVHKTWGGGNLKEIAQTWITQSGFPVVTVKRFNTAHYTISQRHFSYLEVDNKKKWWIPITYATNHKLNFTDTSTTHWIKPKDWDVPIYEPGADWILLNKRQTGYYRVNYDDEIWQNLTQYLKSSNMHRIHPVNRAQLIDDALTMARTNSTKYETAMSLTLYLNREVDYIPWVATFKHLEFLRHKIFVGKHYEIYKRYIRYIMHSVTKNVTYVASPKDDHTTKLLKMFAMKWACIAEVRECVDEAHKQFNAWLKDPNHHLDPDLKPTILCTGLSTASEAVWDQVLKKLSQQTFNKDERPNPLEVLGCSNNRTILYKFLIYSAQRNANIKFETAVRAVLANTNLTGVHVVQYILDFEHDKIKNMDNLLDQELAVVKTMSTVITNRDDFAKLTQFIMMYEIRNTLRISLVPQVMRNVRWIEVHGAIMDDWLLKHEGLFKSSGTDKTFMSSLLIFSIFNTMLFKIFL